MAGQQPKTSCPSRPRASIERSTLARTKTPRFSLAACLSLVPEPPAVLHMSSRKTTNDAAGSGMVVHRLFMGA